MMAGITDDSRNVGRNYVFVAVKGLTHDGHDFIQEAIKKGASKVYGEKVFNHPKYVKVKDSRKKLAELASEFYNHPSGKLKVIGVTGTKGKTTTCHIIHHILTKLGQKTGLISSITVPGFHVTTPDIVTLNRLLKEMVDEGCKYAVLEVSSHGISQGRIMEINFEVGVLTNIAPEHLDYHKTFEEYKRTKMAFMDSAKIKIVSPESTSIKALPGEFNNINAQAAVDTVASLGYARKDALEALSSFKLPEGRMEEIQTSRGFRVFIDFAHTPESLEAALGYIRTIAKRRVISVFGCAGERDSLKRSKMGAISTKIADFSVFTSEDPRSEDIISILKEMESKASKGKYISIPERGEAIAHAFGIAKKGDVVGIFGKGHEQSMAYKGFEHPWSDRKIIAGLLKGKNDISVVILAAGMGTRMNSQTPKILMEICGRPMIAYTLENLRLAGMRDIVVVVGFKKEEVIKRIGKGVRFAVQKTPKGGTADAAKAGFGKISPDCKILVVINGDDSAFYEPETIKKVVADHTDKRAVATFVSLLKDNPFGLGRVVRDKDNNLIGIVEEKDASEDERKIKEVNDGLYVFDKSWFSKNISKVKKGPQGEYYLVDLVKMAVSEKEKTNIFRLPDDSQWHGINTPEQLSDAQKKMEERLKF